MLKNVPSDIDALGDFGQGKAIGRHFEHRALGDDLGALAAMDHAVAHGIGDLLGGVDEFADLALLANDQAVLSASICSPAVVNVPANSNSRAL